MLKCNQFYSVAERMLPRNKRRETFKKITHQASHISHETPKVRNSNLSISTTLKYAHS